MTPIPAWEPNFSGLFAAEPGIRSPFGELQLQLDLCSRQTPTEDRRQSRQVVCREGVPMPSASVVTEREKRK
jgi:hypothetical protein